MTQRSTSSRATGKLVYLSHCRANRSRADFKSGHLPGLFDVRQLRSVSLSHCHQMSIHSTFGHEFLWVVEKGAIVVIVGGSVSILNPPPLHGFLNSNRQVSEVFAADRKSSRQSPSTRSKLSQLGGNACG